LKKLKKKIKIYKWREYEELPENCQRLVGRIKIYKVEKKLAIQYALVKAHCIGKFKMERKVQN
jgi:hypothetical protein